MYHSMSAAIDGDYHGIYQMNKISFQMQMEYLANLNKSIVPLSKLASNQESLVITFDDGFLDTLEIAAPIMAAHNFPFTVFIAPSFIKSNDQRYLDKISLLELSKINGCTIGAHGFTHKPLTECINTDLKNELEDSKKWLEDVLSTSVNTMSYPHGAVDQRVRDAVEESGYQLSASSRPGAYCSTNDPLWLNRTEIWSIDNLYTFEQKVKGYWDWLRYY
jgi:peptidoglycan/xylan/chitin deacetylase (PgdA/CDA1 family)